MRLTKKTRLGALVLTCGLWAAVPRVFTGTPEPPKQEPDAGAAAFFESKIRPTLANRCYACHSAQAKQAQGGLRLDTREGLRRGGNSGTAVVPGEPERSLLIKAIRYADEALQMPPGARLSAEEVADFEAWVRMGAPDPRAAEGGAGATTAARAGASHWAFQPLRDSPPPAIKLRDWARGPIDHFILARLEASGLQPSPPADKRTLIRRAYFGLIGLPPTAAEVDAFAADQAPDAFDRVVDRLLADARYGERWGRHWLDVARYADTKSDGLRFPFSYTYRDWVIRALNEDLPYDQFLIQQLAADLLPGNDRRHLAALGFMALGRDFPGNVHETVDDRIDAATRGLLGLTVSCARCHDHKYDPIPTREYYALYGIFANLRQPAELPLIQPAGAPGERELLYERALAERRAAIADYRRTRHQKLTAELRTPAQLARYLEAAHEARDAGNTELESLARDRDFNLFLLRRWRDYLNRARERRDPVFAVWHNFGAEPAAAAAGGNPLVSRAFAARQPAPASLAEAAALYAALLAKFDQADALPDANAEALRLVLHAPDAPVNVPLAQFELIQTEGDGNNLFELRRRVERLLADYAYRGAPPRAMALEDEPEPRPAHLFVRGNPNNLGAATPPQFLSALSGRPLPQRGPRLELARAIADRDNPLTARVLVNRVWQQHFGAGLVRTPSDFGLRSEPPSHPELLDHLARRFVADGWSIKLLHRMMMLSSAYRQGSADNPAARRVDPENTLLWRMNRRRLDFEALRDSLLYVAGQLDLTIGGPPVALIAQPATRRRTIYGFINRARLPGLLPAFDFPSPEQHSPQRHATTVPQQALFLMNSPFAAEQARRLVARPEVAAERQPARRIEMLYRVIHGRAPSAAEVALGLGFLEAQPGAEAEHADPSAGGSQPAGAWQYGVGEYDAAAQRLKGFTPLRYFTGDAWQVVPLLPDADAGNASLTAGGGEPGDGQAYAVIRRWTAPADGRLAIGGAVRHQQNNAKSGDGVRARILHHGGQGRAGELAAWHVFGVEAKTELSGIEVRQGDTIDFIVDCRAGADNDAFTWAPMLELTGPGGKSRWSASADFRGPAPARLAVWERYAQVLLQTNEFAFVD